MKRILWIDDEKDFLAGHTLLLKQHVLERKYGSDFELESASTVEEALIIILEKSFDLIITDIDMPKKNGLQLYVSIRKNDILTPIIFCTAKAHEEAFQHELETITSKDRSAILMEKPIPYVGDADFESKFISPVLRLLDTGPELPFLITWAEFTAMSEDERAPYFEKAAELNAPFVEQHFARHPDDDWILMAYTPGNVVRSGSAMEEPFADELDRLASEEYKVPVFLYSRTSEIEEISTGSGGRADRKDCGHWRPVKKDDYYPGFCLHFDVPNAKHKITYRVDFDTGADRSFVSLEALLTDKIVRNKPVSKAHSGVLWGHTYWYYRSRFKCQAQGLTTYPPVEISLVFRAVEDWAKSPLSTFHEDRLALIGRAIFFQNDITIELDGKTRNTIVRQSKP